MLTRKRILADIVDAKTIKICETGYMRFVPVEEMILPVCLSGGDNLANINVLTRRAEVFRSRHKKNPDVYNALFVFWMNYDNRPEKRIRMDGKKFLSMDFTLYMSRETGKRKTAWTELSVNVPQYEYARIDQSISKLGKEIWEWVLDIVMVQKIKSIYEPQTDYDSSKIILETIKEIYYEVQSRQFRARSQRKHSGVS